MNEEEILYNYLITHYPERCNKVRNICKKYKLRRVCLKEGTLLYRFVDKPPCDIKPGLFPNKGKNGRFNLYQNVYYCSKSLEGMLQEMGWNNISGSLILSTVVEPINLGFVMDDEYNLLLRGRTDDEPKELVHSELLCKLDLDRKISYHDTSDIFQEVTSLFDDGIIYPSVHSLDHVIGAVMFQLTDDTGFSNIALTGNGFSKIKEWKPIIYWHKGVKHEN